MKLQEGQEFLSLYLDPGTVEYATGGADLFSAEENWERKTREFGQVATPRPVAEMMARWVMSGKPKTVLDPAAGLGMLLHVCQEKQRTVKLVGVERDVETFTQAKRTAPAGTKLVRADYLLSEAGSFDGIIANPPYVKSQRMDYSAGEWEYFDERFGVSLGRLTNLYALFLLKIWEDLAPGGRAAVLLPAEFLNANFGVEIKRRLLKELRPVGLIVFAPELNLFDKALTTSAIIFLERGASKDLPIKAIKANDVAQADAFVNDLLGLSAVPMAFHDFAKFDPTQKWLNTLLEEAPSTLLHHLPKRIGDYFQCRRGIATGANDFFCLNQSLLQEHRLTQDHVVPCITKATDAQGLVFTPTDLRALAESDRRCFLLSPKLNGSRLDAYLRLGEAEGIHQRHLPSHRPVWYQPENRAVAEIWVAVFSREQVKFILNTSGAKNLTCFHGLNSRAENEHLAPLLTLFLNSSWGRIAFSQVNRFYGDGLNKLEPKDVEAMPCVAFPRQTQVQADRITLRLLELEQLPLETRIPALDALVSELLKLPLPVVASLTPEEKEPATSALDPARSVRPSAPRKRRVAPIP